MAIPQNYKVLFLQGGAIGQNAIVPMNLLRGKTTADYISTGDWSKKSIKEAKAYCTVNVAASSEASKFTSIPPQSEWKLNPDAAYVHICSNETIGGVEYHWTPDTGSVPLVADSAAVLVPGRDSNCHDAVVVAPFGMLLPLVSSTKVLAIGVRNSLR